MNAALITLENSAEVQRILQQEAPNKIRNALRSAVRTTTTWANKELDKRMAADSNLPLAVFKKHRIIKKESRDQLTGIETGRIWDGYRRVAAKYAGPSINKRQGGVKVGKFFYAHGFEWHGNVFQRSGAKVRMTKGRYVGKFRQRIFKQYIELPNATIIADAIALEAGAEMQRRFLAKFESANNGVD